MAMMLVCVSSLWIAPDGFSWLHGLSIWTLVCMVAAILHPATVRATAVASPRRPAAAGTRSQSIGTVTS